MTGLLRGSEKLSVSSLCSTINFWFFLQLLVMFRNDLSIRELKKRASTSGECRFEASCNTNGVKMIPVANLFGVQHLKARTGFFTQVSQSDNDQCVYRMETYRMENWHSCFIWRLLSLKYMYSFVV